MIQFWWYIYDHLWNCHLVIYNLIIYRLIFSVAHFQVQDGHQKPIIVFYLLCLPLVSLLSVHPRWLLQTVPEFSPIFANVIKPLPKFSLQARRKRKIGPAQLATKEPISDSVPLCALAGKCWIPRRQCCNFFLKKRDAGPASLSCCSWDAGHLCSIVSFSLILTDYLFIIKIGKLWLMCSFWAVTKLTWSAWSE